MKATKVFDKIKNLAREKDWQLKFVINLMCLIRNNLNLEETISLMKKLERQLKKTRAKEENPYAASLGLTMGTITSKFWCRIKQIESDKVIIEDKYKRANSLIAKLPFHALYSLTTSLKVDPLLSPNTTFEYDVAISLLSHITEIMENK